MILADEGRSGEIPEIERFDLGVLHVRVGESFLAGLHRERTQIAIRERAERGLPDSDNSNRSHIFQDSAPPVRWAVITVVPVEQTNATLDR